MSALKTTTLWQYNYALSKNFLIRDQMLNQLFTYHLPNNDTTMFTMPCMYYITLAKPALGKS